MPRSRTKRASKPAPSAASSLNAALRAYHGGNPDRAARYCADVLSVQPDNADALNLLGGLHMAAGNVQAACDVLSRAAALAPRNDAIHANLGAALASAGRLVEAEACFVRALERNPGDSATLANLARAQKERGDNDAAAGELSRCTERRSW